MKKFKLLILNSIIPLIFSGCFGYEPIEKLGTVVGIGNDLNEEKKPQYSVAFEVLVFKGNNEIDSIVLEGECETIYTAFNEHQTKINKKLFTGEEQVYIFSENRARAGIKDLIDSFLRNSERNYRSFVAVSKQSTKEIFSFKTPFALSSSENLRGLLEFSHKANFFYLEPLLIDLMGRYAIEGMQIVMPYIEIIENNPQVTGLALFKGEKMVEKVSLEEARLINLLSVNNGMGFLSILSEKSEEYMDFNGKNKLKVKVSKEDENLKYDVFVSLRGILTVNSLAENEESLVDNEKVGEMFAEKLKKELTKEVAKMQNEYKTDWLDLSQYAVAKYGRGKGYDSDENFCNAKINVHVKVKIDSSGERNDE